MAGMTFNVADLESLRKRFGPWADLNFPVPEGDTNKQLRWMLRECCGMAEEQAELVAALSDSSKEEALDSIADIAIYSLSFMWHAGFGVQDILGVDLLRRGPCRFEQEWLEGHTGHYSTPLIYGLSYHIGRLSHHVLKTEQNIRKHENHWAMMKMHLSHVWRLMHCLSLTHYNQDLSKLVQSVGEKVLKRDWVKDPDKAHEKTEAEQMSEQYYQSGSYSGD